MPLARDGNSSAFAHLRELYFPPNGKSRRAGTRTSVKDVRPSGVVRHRIPSDREITGSRRLHDDAVTRATTVPHRGAPPALPTPS